MITSATILFRVAHASRVLVATSRRNSLSMRNRPALNFAHLEKFAMARTPSPARETRALPRRIRDPKCFLGAAPGEGEAGAAVAVVVNDGAAVAKLRAFEPDT
jgi:hypothetical protein